MHINIWSHIISLKIVDFVKVIEKFFNRSDARFWENQTWTFMNFWFIVAHVGWPSILEDYLKNCRFIERFSNIFTKKILKIISNRFLTSIQLCGESGRNDNLSPLLTSHSVLLLYRPKSKHSYLTGCWFYVRKKIVLKYIKMTVNKK